MRPTDLETHSILGDFGSNPVALEDLNSEDLNSEDLNSEDLAIEDLNREDPATTASTAPSEALRFTDYLEVLEEDMEPPDPGLFTGLLGSLRSALVHEMRRRALWEAPPRYLGIVGGGSWDERELLEELLLDCYEFVFVRRLPGLKKQLMARPNVDGMVFLAIRHFLHEAQKRHDPLGFRVFQMARSAVLLLLEKERLHLLEGDAHIRCDTMLAFAPWCAPDLCRGVDLRPQVESWNAWLVHDLVAAHHREPVVERLAEAVASLAQEGVEVFRFRDLVEPLKADVRSRWQALAPHLAAGENPTLDAMMLPGADYEARQQFQVLLQCTSQGLDRLEVRKKTRDYLHRLWLFLRQWAVEANEPEVPTDRPPSDARLGELLGIPRARLPELREMLGEVVQSCRSGVFSTEAPQSVRDGKTNGRSNGGGGELPIRRLDERRNQLRQETAAAATRWARSLRLPVESRRNEAWQAPRPVRKRRRQIRWLKMAAGLLAVVGLSFLWRLESSETPFLVPLSSVHGITVGDVTRGDDDSILEVVKGQQLVVNIGLWRIEPQPWYRMEILDQGEIVMWSSERVAAQDEFLLILPEDWLPAGYYRLRIYGIGEDGIERLLKESSSIFEPR